MRRTIALFRPGGGLLARFNRATLFIQSDLESPAAADLIGAFRALSSADQTSIALVRAMARVVAQHEFERVPPFTCVAADEDQVHAIVYGSLSVQVRTDRHAELLDASYAVTWVDRRVDGALVDVSVGDVPDANRAWFVTEGVVPASGALVCFADSPASATTDEQAPPAVASPPLAAAAPEPAESPAPAEVSAPAIAAAPVLVLAPDEPAASIMVSEVPAVPTVAVVDSPPPVVVSEVPIAPTVVVAEAPAPAIEPEPVVLAEVVEFVDTHAVPAPAETVAVAAEVAEQTATVIDLRDHRQTIDTPPPPPPPPDAAPLEPSASVLPPPPPPPYSGADTDLEAETEESGRTLTLIGAEVRTVAGLQCQAGHLNRPDALRCSQCTAPLDRSSGTVIGARPSLGTLTFEHTDDSVALTRPVVVGSAPPEDLVIAGEGAAFVQVEGEGVSGTQFEVHLDNWDAYVIDRSVTGTYLDDTSGRRHRLPRHARVKLKVGSAIVFGDHRVRIDAPEV